VDSRNDLGIFEDICKKIYLCGALATEWRLKLRCSLLPELRFFYEDKNTFFMYDILTFFLFELRCPGWCWKDGRVRYAAIAMYRCRKSMSCIVASSFHLGFCKDNTAGGITIRWFNTCRAQVEWSGIECFYARGAGEGLYWGRFKGTLQLCGPGQGLY
jgi:hypothetical protein